MNYFKDKSRFELTSLKNILSNRLNIYKGWLENFPNDELDIQEKLLRSDLRNTITELTIEIMSLSLQLRDLDF